MASPYRITTIHDAEFRPRLFIRIQRQRFKALLSFCGRDYAHNRDLSIGFLRYLARIRRFIRGQEPLQLIAISERAGSTWLNVWRKNLPSNMAGQLLPDAAGFLDRKIRQDANV
jgi:hypothetical protein